jgi:hypothetical protein
MPTIRRSRRLSTRICLLAVTAGSIAGLESPLPTRQTNASTSAVRAEVLTRGASPSPAAKTRINEAYGRLPLSFEANRGQTDSEVDFLVRGAGYTMLLKPTEAVLAMRSPADQESKTGSPKAGRLSGVLQPDAHLASRTKSSVVRMQLVGADATAHGEGQEVLPGTINYFRGNDPTQWRTGISTYAKVRYTAVFPGIDLVYYGNQRQLEYDLIVAPGADPSAIALTFAGAEKVEVNGEGNVIVHTADGQLVQRVPRVYQEIDGIKKNITGRYVLEGGEHHDASLRTESLRPMLSSDLKWGRTTIASRS